MILVATFEAEFPPAPAEEAGADQHDQTEGQQAGGSDG